MDSRVTFGREYTGGTTITGVAAKQGGTIEHEKTCSIG